MLRRAVFINLEAWLQSSEASGQQRPSVHIDLIPTLSAGGTNAQMDSLRRGKAEARRIVIQHADDISGLTWAGQSYENNNIQPSGRPIVEKVNLQDGIDLRATEAVLISFG